MNSIFVSYRRVDSQDVTARMVDSLTSFFGDGNIFRDVYDIDIGRDFGAVLKTALEDCAIFLPIIGPRWLKEIWRRDENHQRGSANTDWVRVEVATALSRGIPIIPILIRDAQLPSADELPDDLKGLATQTAFSFNIESHEQDVERLLRKILDLPNANDLWNLWLQKSLNFSQEELALNKQGVLSLRQKQHLMRVPFGRILLGLPVLLLGLLPFVGNFLFSQLGASDVVRYFCVVCTALPSLLLFYIFLPAFLRMDILSVQATVEPGKDAKRVKVGTLELLLMNVVISPSAFEMFRLRPLLIHYSKPSVHGVLTLLSAELAPVDNRGEVAE